ATNASSARARGTCGFMAWSDGWCTGRQQASVYGESTAAQTVKGLLFTARSYTLIVYYAERLRRDGPAQLS
ncbi:hypothetical protein, partial [Comamonas terrigena]|uniref:hypothetical protein n=1 Tax=Comamonas terrigena TaxID=32013 RepID=UPI002446BE9D